MNRACYCLLAAAVPLALAGCDRTTAANSTAGKPAAAWIAEGDAALAKDNFDGALDAFANAVDQEPESAPARAARAGLSPPGQVR